VMIEPSPTIEVTLPAGSKADNPPGRQGRLLDDAPARDARQAQGGAGPGRELQRRDFEACDGGVTPTAYWGGTPHSNGHPCLDRLRLVAGAAGRVEVH
jgi:hypothetical protein